MNRLISCARRRVVATFLAGLITILPLVITIAVIVWVASFIQGFVGPKSLLGGWLQSVGMRLAPAGDTTLAYFIGCLLVLASIFLLGMFVRTGIRKFFDTIVEAIMRRIPIAGSVYGAATQVVGLLQQQDESELKKMSVVFCRFGEDSGAAFLALLPTPERFRIDDVDYHILMVPTAPVPMGGSLIFVPVKSVRPTNLSMDAFMSIYVSMGVTGPQFLKDKS
jgi:uncharacterized membrane protein